MSNPEHAEHFEWDDNEEESGNTAHLAAHGIATHEAEEVFANGGVFVPNKRSGSGDWKLIGPTNGGRLLTLILVYKAERRVLRVFTGWESTNAERRRWYD